MCSTIRSASITCWWLSVASFPAPTPRPPSRITKCSTTSASRPTSNSPNGMRSSRPTSRPTTGWRRRKRFRWWGSLRQPNRDRFQLQVGMRKRVIKTLIVGVMLVLSASLPALGQSEVSVAQLRETFAHPPDDCRNMMRWWWFGPAVSKSEIQRELEQMKAAGIGGVEIATLYPLALDDPQTGFRNLTYLSDDHIDALRFAAAEARKLGLEIVPISPGLQSIQVPNIDTGEQLIASFVVPGPVDALEYKHAKQVPASAIENARLRVPVKLDGPVNAVFFISSRTGMTVRRPAVGAEGFVLDHYDRRAITTHLHAVGDRLMEAFGDHPPYAVFSDSLEDEGSDWTGDFP